MSRLMDAIQTNTTLAVKPPPEPGELVPGRVLPTAPWPHCPLCHDPVKDEGFFWQGSENVAVDYSHGVGVVAVDEVFHPGCLHPWVIVVTEPLDGKTAEGVHVGQLHGAPDGNGGWWLVLEPIVVSKKQAIRAYQVSIPWDRVRRIELRYDR